MIECELGELSEAEQSRLECIAGRLDRESIRR